MSGERTELLVNTLSQPIRGIHVSRGGCIEFFRWINRLCHSANLDDGFRWKNSRKNGILESLGAAVRGAILNQRLCLQEKVAEISCPDQACPTRRLAVSIVRLFFESFD